MYEPVGNVPIAVLGDGSETDLFGMAEESQRVGCEVSINVPEAFRQRGLFTAGHDVRYEVVEAGDGLLATIEVVQGLPENRRGWAIKWKGE